MDLDSWSERVDLETPAGKALRTLIDFLPEDAACKITLFGSAPIQLTIDRGLLSGEVDLFRNMKGCLRLLPRPDWARGNRISTSRFAAS